MDQGFLIRDALPFSVPSDPRVCEAPVMDEGLATIRSFGSIDAGDNGDIAVEVYAGLGVGNFFGLEGKILGSSQGLGLVLNRAMMIDADEGVGDDGCGRRCVVVNFRLIPGTLQSQEHALISGGIRLVLRDGDRS